jgi:hypothetical protein
MRRGAHRPRRAAAGDDLTYPPVIIMPSPIRDSVRHQGPVYQPDPLDDSAPSIHFLDED